MEKENDPTSPKKRKVEVNLTESCKTFDGTKVISVLNDKQSQKVLFVHAKSKENEDVVIILERKPFNTTADGLAGLLSKNTELKADLQNDIYSTFSATTTVQNEIKATIICPASEKHINKYRKQDLFIVTETAQKYTSTTLPYIKQQFQDKIFNLQWVYNILEHKAETDRIIFEDNDPEVGFVLLPDMKWDTSDKKSLYVIVLPHKRGLKSIRDLRAAHLPLLENIRDKSCKVLTEKFSIPSSQLRLYFHYQPSFYHLHVHINHIELDLPGTSALRAHLLNDVIENLQISDDFYESRTMTFALQQNDKLYAAWKDD